MNHIFETQKAVKIVAAGRMEVMDGMEIPNTGSDEVLVKVKAVAINPFDGKSADLSPTHMATVGCDYSGTIVAVGDDIGKPRKIGDRVCGFIFGNNPNRQANGAFAEFVAVPADLIMSIPPSMDFETAATLGVGTATAGVVLYHELGLPMPVGPCKHRETGKYALVSGGSTATGTLTIQLLRLAGFAVICTCSPQHFALVKGLGAVEAFDYRSQMCGDDIRRFTTNTLAYAVDCVTTAASMQMCYEAVGTAGGRYVSLDPFPLRCHSRRSVRPSWVLALTLFGRAIPWARPYGRPGRTQDREFGRRWMSVAEHLLEEGILTPHPHRAMSGGLWSVPDGVERVRAGQASGMKLVYRVEEA